PEMNRRLQDAGARAGEIEIGLLWNNRNDLDLHVTDPGGEHIYYGQRTSRSGGELDVDRNAGCGGNITSEPVEHIVWTSNAPEGEFHIEVEHYRNCGQADPTRFTVQLKLDGDVTTFDGEISFLDPPVSVHRFSNDGSGSGSDTVPSSSSSSSGSFLPYVAQVLGWIFFGAMVGLSQGIVRRSSQAIKNAGMGGALGGAVGGIVFLLIAKSLGASSPGASRAVGFAILGAAIGLFMVLVEQALSAALVIVSGRFEGREVFLDRPVMRIGRGELLEIYIGGDAQMQTHHATIEKNASGHVISASEGALLVNGTAVNSQQLSNGDMIDLGSTRLAYRWKAASGETSSAEHHDTGEIYDPPVPGPIAEPTPVAGQEPASSGAQPPPPPARKSRPAPETPSSTSWKTEPQPPSPRIPDKPGEHRGPPPPPPPPSRKK
ncbi:MAG: FHA domain-containing protein, partial [Pirellulaceae bacterium]